VLIRRRDVRLRERRIGPYKYLAVDKERGRGGEHWKQKHITEGHKRPGTKKQTQRTEGERKREQHT
jgi:hypothetical protein